MGMVEAGRLIRSYFSNPCEREHGAWVHGAGVEMRRWSLQDLLMAGYWRDRERGRTLG